MIFQTYRGKFGQKHSFWVKMVLIVSVFVIQFSVMAAGDDDYLNALNQEAQKVGEKDATPEGSGSAGEINGNSVSRDVFEAELKEKYAGSSLFYGKLPEAAQEEIYLEYRDGVSISVLRKKIMDRFLHR